MEANHKQELKQFLIAEIGVDRTRLLVNRLAELGISLGDNADYLYGRQEIITKIISAHQMLDGLFDDLVQLKRQTRKK